MLWHARDGVGRLGTGIPKSDFWANAKGDRSSRLRLHTAQGFEFDYVRVITGLTAAFVRGSLYRHNSPYRKCHSP